jgi:hypothetical protein
MRLFLYWIAACAFAAAVPGGAAAGAWPQRPGASYFKIAGAYLYSEHEYDSQGEKVDILASEPFTTDTGYRDVSFTAYLEHGIDARLTLVGSLPFKILTSTRTETTGFADLSRAVEVTNGGLSDLSLGLRYPLQIEPFPVSVQGNVKVPLRYDAQPENGGPPLGSGALDLDLNLLAGASLWPVPGYVGASVGYRLRGGDLADEIVFNVEAGAGWERFAARVTLDGTYSTTRPEPLTESATTTVSNQDLLKLLPAIEFNLGAGTAIVSEAYHVLAGRNTVAGTTWALGLVLRR